MVCGTPKNKPNFLIVGAAKCGTTSLVNYLKEHKDIYIPDVKEPRFFIKDIILSVSDEDPIKKNILLKKSVLNEKDYFQLYDVQQKMRGDASVHYLYHHKEVIPKIKKYIGDVPIIIMLRNPVNRAISNINYLKNVHNNSILDEIELENYRKSKNYNSFWYYKEQGFYFNQVKAYIENFSRVKVLIFEEFKNDTNKVVNEVFDFLEVDGKEFSEFKVYNASLEENRSYLFLKKTGTIRILKKVINEKKRKQLKKKFSKFIHIPSKSYFEKVEKQRLFSQYREDILNLEKILKKQLWKSVN